MKHFRLKRLEKELSPKNDHYLEYLKEVIVALDGEVPETPIKPGEEINEYFRAIARAIRERDG